MRPQSYLGPGRLRASRRARPERAPVSRTAPLPRTRAPAWPPALPRGALVLLGTASGVIVVAGLRGVAGIVGPVFLALMLTVAVSPLTGWLRRHGAPTGLAMLATLITVYLMLFGMVAALGISVAQLVDLMPTYQARFIELQDELVHRLSGLGISVQQLHDATSGADPHSVVNLVEWLFGGLVGALSNTLFLLAVVLFMCVDATGFPARLDAVADRRPELVDALLAFARGTRRYLLVTTVFGLIVATIDTLLLWALGVPLPLLWGLLSFITNYIPNIGFIVGVVPPALLGLLDGGVHTMALVIVLYCLVNFAIQSVIQPKVVGDAVGLSATMSFLSLVFWAWVLGALGALLAIPLTLLAKGLLVDVDPASRWVNALLSGDVPAAAKHPAAKQPRG